MVKAFLTIFLALALVAQGGLVCIQVDNDHSLTVLMNTGRIVHAANNDFDDEQRGAKAYALAPAGVPAWIAAVTKPTRHDAQTTSLTPNRRLFKLKAAFLI